MNQDEKWLIKNQEVKDFMEHDPEERYKFFNWLKQQRKMLNAGTLKS